MKSPRVDAQRSASGMTLLELTVVILVLLSLVSVLFLGARAWKKGSDRAGCILQIRNVQQAVRSYSNLNGYNAGATVAGLKGQLIGGGRFVEKIPSCPGSGTYSYLGDTIPNVGTLYASCSLAIPESHVPGAYLEW